jgi:hypothetical protein
MWQCQGNIDSVPIPQQQLVTYQCSAPWLSSGLSCYFLAELFSQVTLMVQTKETKGRSSGQAPFTLKPKQLALKKQIVTKKKYFFITGLAAQKAHFRQK